MTLIAEVGEKLGGRTTELDNLGRRKYVRQFYVETTDPRVGPLAARTAVAVALPVGTYYTNGLVSTDPLYEFDMGAFVESIAAAEEGDTGTGWLVTVSYGPFDWTLWQEEAALWPVRVTCGGERLDRVIYFDNAGNPIVNSAGDPFGDPVTVDDSRIVLMITRNEKVSTFGLEVPYNYSDTINNADWNGFPARTCRMGVITTGDPTYDPNGHYYYYTVTYPVTLNRFTWRKQLLDQGFNELDSSTTPRPRPIMNAGQPVTEAVPLDGAGHRLAAGAVPVTLPYDCEYEADWSGLGIDLSLRLGA